MTPTLRDVDQALAETRARFSECGREQYTWVTTDNFIALVGGEIVQAGKMSAPILERFGFETVSQTHALLDWTG